MAKMMPLSFFLIAFFLCGLHGNAHAARITIQADKTNATYPDAVKITCTPRGLKEAPDHVYFLQILKGPANEKKPVATVRKDNPEVSLAEGLSDTSSGVGQIDADITKSYVTLTLLEPKQKDAGVYTCSVYYSDTLSELEDDESSRYLKVAFNKEREMKDIEARIKTLEHRLRNENRFLDSKIRKSFYVVDDNLNKQRNEAILNNNERLSKIASNPVDLSTVNALVNNLFSKLTSKLMFKLGKVNETIVNKRARMLRFIDNVDFEVQKKLYADVDRLEFEIRGLAPNDSLANVVQVVNQLEDRHRNQSGQINLLSNKVSGISGDLDDVVDLMNQNMVQVLQQTSGIASKESVNKVAERVTTLERRVEEDAALVDYLQGRASNASFEFQDLNSTNLKLTKIIEEITAKEANRTAFSASPSQQLSTSTGQVLVFDDVIANQGQGYDNYTGEFTAPRPGVYEFHLVLTTRLSGDGIDADLKANNETLVRLSSKVNEHDDQTAVSTVCQLEAGDVVKAVVTKASAGDTVVNDKFSIFSGYFIQPL